MCKIVYYILCSKGSRWCLKGIRCVQCNSHKTSSLKGYYFKHTTYASCLLALGLIFLSIGFLRVTHCISSLPKRSNISLAVLMFPHEIRLSRQWHQGSMLRERQGGLIDGHKAGASVWLAVSRRNDIWAAQVGKDKSASVSIKTSAGSGSAWGKGKSILNSSILTSDKCHQADCVVKGNSFYLWHWWSIAVVLYSYNPSKAGIKS